MDVVETEPLPTTSELWGLGNVLLSPHCADRTKVRALRGSTSGRSCSSIGRGLRAKARARALLLGCPVGSGGGACRLCAQEFQIESLQFFVSNMVRVRMHTCVCI